MDPGDQKTVEGIVAHVLKDPQAARFRDLRAFSRDGGSLVCGQVAEAKSFGAAAGYVRFALVFKASGDGYAPQAPVMERSPDDGRPSDAWKHADPACR